MYAWGQSTRDIEAAFCDGPPLLVNTLRCVGRTPHPQNRPCMIYTLDRSELEMSCWARRSWQGTTKVEGNKGIRKQLASTLVVFDPRF